MTNDKRDKNKHKNEVVTNNYFNSICDKYTNNIKFSKKTKLENYDEMNYIPTYNDYKMILLYNYNTQQLKNIAKTYKLKISGNKTELVSRIYIFLYLSSNVVKIQKVIKGYLQRKYNKCHGPGFLNRDLCSNVYDFLSMDELKNIPKEQFFSYKDDDKFIYGFDIISLYNLIYKCNGAIKNPFNTKPIEAKVIENFRSLLRLSKVLSINIVTSINDVTQEVSKKKSVELKALSLFQNIDLLGNYSDPKWFLNLNKIQLIHFVRELIDIWQYRSNLSLETKRLICPPLGNPFPNNFNTLVLTSSENIDDVRSTILDILNKLVVTGIDKDSKCLGAYYILCALTLVSPSAATSLPWLFQAVS